MGGGAKTAAEFSTESELLIRKIEKMESTWTGNEKTESYGQGEVGRLMSH